MNIYRKIEFHLLPQRLFWFSFLVPLSFIRRYLPIQTHFSFLISRSLHLSLSLFRERELFNFSQLFSFFLWNSQSSLPVTRHLSYMLVRNNKVYFNLCAPISSCSGPGFCLLWRMFALHFMYVLCVGLTLGLADFLATFDIVNKIKVTMHHIKFIECAFAYRKYNVIRKHAFDVMFTENLFSGQYTFLMIIIISQFE